MKNLCLLCLCLLFFAMSAMAQDTSDEYVNYQYSKGRNELSNENYEEALKCFTYVIDALPDNPYVYQLRGLTLLLMGQGVKALPDLNISLRLFPKKDKAAIANSYQLRGDVLTEIGDTLSAIDNYSTSIKLDPSDAAVFISRGKLYGMTHMIEESVKDFRKAIQIDPAKVEAYLCLAISLNSMSKWEDAIAVLDKALTLDVRYSWAYAERAESYIGLKDWKQATSDVLSALGIEYNSHAMDILYESEGELYHQLLKCMEYRAPQEPLWQFVLGELYRSHEQYEKAIVCYEKSLKDNESAFTVELISLCYEALGDGVRSYEYAEKAVQMEPDNEEFMERLKAQKKKLQTSSADTDSLLTM